MSNRNRTERVHIPSNRHVHDERGFTLVELLIVILLLTIITAALSSSIVTALENQQRQVETTHALNQAKIALERVTREVRGANPVMTAEADLVAVMVKGADPDPTTEEEDRLVVFSAEPGEGGLKDLYIKHEDGTSVALVRGLSLDGQSVFTYYDEEGNQLPLVEGAVEDPAAIKTVEILLPIAQPKTGVVDLGDSITLRNYQAEPEEQA